MKISSHDVALIAYKFQASYSSTAYKLNDLDYISRKELDNLLEKKQDGLNFLRIFKLQNPIKIKNDDNYRLESTYLWKIGRLAIEAYRQKIIDKEKFISVCNKINIPGEELIKFVSYPTT